MSNPYYNVSGVPVSNADITSVALRSEFAAIAAGFDVVAAGQFPDAVYANYGLDNQVAIGVDASAGGDMSIGLSGRTVAGTPYIDFNSSTNAIDYDARILVVGGTATPGQAGMVITCDRLTSSNRFKCAPIAAAPGTPEAGDFYFDSILLKHRGYDGTTWNNFY